MSGDPNPLYDKVTVQGTRRLIDGLQSFEVEQFVFASTMLVHKPTATPEERISEESPIGASWAYPQSKVGTEALLHERHGNIRSEEHTSELQSLMRISYAVFCLKKKNNKTQ